MAAFPTTRWTLIRQAVAHATPESKSALESLCQQYSVPVLTFLQHRISSRENAEDIAQGFFAQLIEHNFFDRADEDRGRFRSFLLHALRGYMADVYDHNNAIKRGGRNQIVAFDAAHDQEPQHESTAERQFELQWVRTLLSHSLNRLQQECLTTGKADLYTALHGFLDNDTTPKVSDVARQLRMSESAVRVAVHRLRKRLGHIIRLEIADTVQSPSEVEDELNRLMQILETER